MVTPSETVLKAGARSPVGLGRGEESRGQERRRQKGLRKERRSRRSGAKVAREPQPWLGRASACKSTTKLMPLLAAVLGEQYRQMMQTQS